MGTQPLDTLPGRLRPVFAAILEGKTNLEIAQANNLQQHTVENYVSQILSILQCRDRVELIVKHRSSVTSQNSSGTPL